MENNGLPSVASDGVLQAGNGARGRKEQERTVQVSLRLPVSQIHALRERALDTARKEQTMITPQEIMRRIITSALKPEN